MRAQFLRLVHITHTMVHPSFGQMLIRQGWKTSLPAIGLSISMWVGARVDPTHPKANNTWLGLRLSFLSQKGAFWGNLYLPPFDSKCTAQSKECIVYACAVFETCSHHHTHTMVHPSLGQVLIRQGWKVSLIDVGLSKSMQAGVKVDLAYPKVDNTWLGLRLSFLPQKGVFWGLRGNPHLPPSAFIALSLSEGVHSVCMRSFWDLLTSHTL